MSIFFPAMLEKPLGLWDRAARWVAGQMPTGLYARALLIVILPMVLLQSVIAYFFMERHWQSVTFKLAEALTHDIAAIVELHSLYPTPAADAALTRIANASLKLDIEIMPPQALPPALPKPFFSLIDSAVSNELRRQVKRPFWIDTVGRSSLIEIRVQMNDGVLRILADRNAAYASNSHIFLVWMVGTSCVLLAVAIAFLRNQIRPVLRLAKAAQNFGKGRSVDYRPHGAREVRQAGYAFIEMKRRVERTIEQRTMMLNGVSHDLRTILTRFRLSLALMPAGVETEDMQRDVEEMQGMLEAYLAFARGDLGEPASPVDLRGLLDELKADAERHGHPTQVDCASDLRITLRPAAFKRCLFNLVSNAQRHGRTIALAASAEARFLTVHVDDDGPGIAPSQRDIVFRPFFRLDAARNQDEGGTGLGLAIARDIARAHGGDVTLGDSPLGGLRASVRVPA